MKKVIRESVFETNSSSAHSITFKPFNKEGERCHFAIVSPLQKIILLRSLVANSEESYRWREEEFIRSLQRKREEAGFSDEYLRRELEKRVSALLEKNDFPADYFDPIEKESEEELFDFYSVWEDESKEKEAFCDLFGSVWDKDCRSFALYFLTLVENEYRKSKGIDKEGLEKEIENAPIHRGGRLFNGKMSVTCNRFFCEGALDECDCGFGSYYDIAKNLASALNIDRYRLLDETQNLQEKARLFLSEEYCFACNEYYLRRGKGREINPTEDIY